MTDAAVEIVRAWHAALNAGDVDQLVALSAADVEVGGPRGSGHGAELLREWFARAGVGIVPVRVYARDGVVVVEQDATWPGGAPQRVASAFAVADGVVTKCLRYADLAEALLAVGLDESARVGD